MGTIGSLVLDLGPHLLHRARRSFDLSTTQVTEKRMSILTRTPLGKHGYPMQGCKPVRCRFPVFQLRKRGRRVAEPIEVESGAALVCSASNRSTFINLTLRLLFALLADVPLRTLRLKALPSASSPRAALTNITVAIFSALHERSSDRRRLVNDRNDDAGSSGAHLCVETRNKCRPRSPALDTSTRNALSHKSTTVRLVGHRQR